MGRWDRENLRERTGSDYFQLEHRSDERSSAAQRPRRPRRYAEGAATSACYVFYGFSGSQSQPLPKWPDGTDHDSRFKLAAETLAKSLRRLFPTDDVRVVQAWTKDIILDTILAAKLPIREVHLCCHGDATRLSLSLDYNHTAWVELIADKMDHLAQLTWSGQRILDDKAIGELSIKSELALCAGLFSSVLSWWTRMRLQRKFRSDAAWMIWGCYAGGESATYGSGRNPPPVKRYFGRMNLGASSVDGIAKEIARELGVKCTAATGHGGTQFWHLEKREKKLVLVKNDKHTHAKLPHWMWGVAKSHWVTYDKAGNLEEDAYILGLWRSKADLLTEGHEPPAWLTRLYDPAIH
ncbi:MAG: hypothetical protein WKG01_13960 [Kofleriaceae bacterium]